MIAPRKRAIESVRERNRQSALNGDAIALSVLAQAAELGHNATDWVFRDYGEDPATVSHILHAMAKDD